MSGGRNDPDYPIERILDKKTENRRTFYLVKWADSWQPSKNVAQADIRKWEKERTRQHEEDAEDEGDIGGGQDTQATDGGLHPHRSSSTRETRSTANRSRESGTVGGGAQRLRPSAAGRVTAADDTQEKASESDDANLKWTVENLGKNVVPESIIAQSRRKPLQYEVMWIDGQHRGQGYIVANAVKPELIREWERLVTSVTVYPHAEERYDVDISEDWYGIRSKAIDEASGTSELAGEDGGHGGAGHDSGGGDGHEAEEDEDGVDDSKAGQVYRTRPK